MATLLLQLLFLFAQSLGGDLKASGDGHEVVAREILVDPQDGGSGAGGDPLGDGVEEYRVDLVLGASGVDSLALRGDSVADGFGAGGVASGWYWKWEVGQAWRGDVGHGGGPVRDWEAWSQSHRVAGRLHALAGVGLDRMVWLRMRRRDDLAAVLFVLGDSSGCRLW